MRPAGPHRIIQIHPTLRCNLRCLHCYSSSGPDRSEALPIDALNRALSDARALGYRVAGFSGGEPLLYPELHDALAHAHGLGMVTTVTTNGMLLDRRRLDVLAGVVDLLAISVDGVPSSHDVIRAHAGAFSRVEANLEHVRAAGIPFGFIFTLTQHNVDELHWVARFALESGARLLQIHPLEEVGRARSEMIGSTPDSTEGAVAFVEARRIQKVVGDVMSVQLDLAHRDLLTSALAPDDDDDPRALLAEVLSPLVVETDGWVVPLQYGFPRRFAVGNCVSESLAEAATRWRATVYPHFSAMCRDVVDELVRQGAAHPFVNVYASVGERAGVSRPVRDVATGARAVRG